jgi:hypothetical protein
MLGLMASSWRPGSDFADEVLHHAIESSLHGAFVDDDRRRVMLSAKTSLDAGAGSGYRSGRNSCPSRAD